MSEMIDYQAILVGPPGVGKTSLLRELVGDHLRNRAMVLVMDCNRQLADLIAWFPTVAHFKAEQVKRQTESKPLLLAAAIGSGESAELIRYAVALAAKCNKAREEGKPGTPAYVALCFDEVTLIKGVTQYHLPTEMEELLGNRRHRGLALVILCQSFGQLHPRWQDFATVVYLFRTKNRKRLTAIADRFGLILGDVIREVRALPQKYAYLAISQERFLLATERLTA